MLHLFASVDIGGAAGAATAAVVLLAALGSGFAIFRANAAQSTITILRQNGEALEQQNGILRTELTQAQQQLEEQAAELRALRDTVTAKAAIELLDRKVDLHHDQVMAELAHIGGGPK